MSGEQKVELRTHYQHRDDEYWDWRDFAEQFTVTEILEALEFPSNDDAIYYNIHTGCEKPLYLLFERNIIGPLPANEHSFNLAMELEHWLPRISEPNPVIARSLALTEYQAKEQVALSYSNRAETAKTIEGFFAAMSQGGCTLEDGSCTINASKRKAELTLHDGRHIVFPLGWIWNYFHGSQQQPLF